MISTVQTPLPMRAAIEPNDWPHFCAPSPESLMISMTCSSIVWTALRGRSGVAAFIAGLPWQADADVAVLRAVDAEQLRIGPGRRVGIDVVGVAQAQECLHRARRAPAGAHGLDD